MHGASRGLDGSVGKSVAEGTVKKLLECDEPPTRRVAGGAFGRDTGEIVDFTKTREKLGYRWERRKKKERVRFWHETVCEGGTGLCKEKSVNDAEMLEQDIVRYPTDCVRSQKRQKRSSW